jgi:hypothetical protein
MQIVWSLPTECNIRPIGPSPPFSVTSGDSLPHISVNEMKELSTEYQDSGMHQLWVTQVNHMWKHTSTPKKNMWIWTWLGVIHHNVLRFLTAFRPDGRPPSSLLPNMEPVQ